MGEYSSRVFQNIYRLFKSPDTWTILALIAWFLVYHLPVTLGQRVFSEGDILWGNLPIRAEVTRALSTGKLPLWTPLLQAGMPLFAEGHTAALYPLNLIIHHLLPPHVAISYIILINLSWMALGMYFFCRACGLGIWSSFLAGVAFGASGAVTARVSHLDVLTPISWLSWLLFFQARYWQTHSLRQSTLHWFALSSVAIGLQCLSGSPAIIMLNLIVYVAFGLLGSVLWHNVASFQIQPKNFLKSLLVVSGSILLGLGIGAVQLIPTAELIGWSIRGQDLGRTFFTSYSLEPLALSQFLAPFAYLGVPSADNMEFWGYFGVLPLILAITTPFLRRDFRTWFFALFAILALVLALGGSTPLYDWLYYVPIFNRFRVPARFLFLVLFASIFLAATGFDELQNRLPVVVKPKILYVIGIPAILVVTLGLMLLGSQLSLEFWMALWQWLPIGLGLLSGALLVFAIVHKPSRPIFQMLIIGITSLDLAMFTAPFLSTLARTSPVAELAQVPRTVLAMDQREPIARSWVLKFPSVTQASVRATMWSGLPMAYGRAGIIRGYMPFSLALRRNEEYIQQMSRSMRNLINIRYYLLPLEIAPPETESPLDETQPEDGLTLEVLQSQPAIPPTRAIRLSVVSYTDQTTELPDGFVAGEIILTWEDGSHQVLPLRLGIETADWAYEGMAQITPVKHSQPVEAFSFPAYLRSVGRDFQGKKYIARFALSNPSAMITAIGVRSFLPGAGLTIEHIDFIDQTGEAVSLSKLLKRSDLALAFRSHTAAMWDNRDVMPRAFIVYAAEIVPDSQTLDRMQDPEFDPYQIVFLSADTTPDGFALNSPGSGKGVVGILDYQSDHVVLQATTDQAGYLVLTDAWYPGWVAWVDGVETPIYRADYIFRAVHLDSGEHRIEFEYRPWSFAIGAWVSGLSCVLVILIALAGYWRGLDEKIR